VKREKKVKEYGEARYQNLGLMATESSIVNMDDKQPSVVNEEVPSSPNVDQDDGAVFTACSLLVRRP